MHPKTETFLDRVTTGLASDPELRLDVQAELRAHVADKLAELGGEEHADEAVASLGEVVELAEEVAAANQRRLGWRALARHLLRFGLVPLAVLAAVFLSDFGRSLGMFQAMDSLGTGDSLIPAYWDWLKPHRRLSIHEQIVLHGDGRRGGAERYRTLWEQNPTDRVYYADYITHVLDWLPIDQPGPPTTPQEMAWSTLLFELAQAKSVDPQNGRYPLLTGVTKAQMAAKLETTKAPDGKTPVYTITVKDRAALDQAMRELLAAMSMPEYHCYHREMLAERLAPLPLPTSLVETLQRIEIASSVSLPDMGKMREAGRYAAAYAQLLVKEGLGEEALPYLSVPEALAKWTAEDSFTLIEMLFSHALTNMAREIVPKTLRETGHEEEAEEVQRRLDAVRAPMQEWKDNRDDGENEIRELLARRGGWLANGLLPQLGRQDMANLETRLDAGRFLEFTVVTEGLVSLLDILLVIAMLACLLISVSWRLALGSQAAPLLLLPSWRDMARFILLGVVLPFAVFLAWTRWMPFSGQAHSFRYSPHRVLVEFFALVLALLLVPSWLAIGSFRRRCAELKLPPPPRIHWVVRGLFWLAGGLLAIVYLVPPKMWPFPRLSFLILVLGSLLVALAVLALAGLSLFVPRHHARTVGTLSRSLIPVFATAILVLCLVVNPLLRVQERQLLHADTILATTEEPGSTRIETELGNRLRDATLKAMAENPMPPITPQ